MVSLDLAFACVLTANAGGRSDFAGSNPNKNKSRTSRKSKKYAES
jgi:hypothetical protein